MTGSRRYRRRRDLRPRHRLADGSAVGRPPAAADGRCSATEEVPLLSAPERAFGGDFDRCWLLAVQLYGVRSARNWGMGDFTDLADLIELAHHLGADGVGLNPLHALFDDRPAIAVRIRRTAGCFSMRSISMSRRFRNFASDADDAGRAGAGCGQATSSITSRVAALKWRGAARRPSTPSRRDATAGAQAGIRKIPRRTRRRCCRASPASRCCATSSTSRGGNGRSSGGSRMTPDAPNCARARMRPRSSSSNSCNGPPIGSWRRAKDRADRLGMKVGLYLDVAVGVQSDGFDAWNEQAAISRHLGVGAPPDPLNTAGQSWGLAGFNATGLEQQSFEPYREMLRASMRHAGAIRLDHVLGLKRLYLVPQGFGAADGVYVQMPFEALLAATAQESVANRCVVIGEDLGTVPEGFPRADRRLGHLVVSGDDVRARGPRRRSKASTIIWPMRSSPSTPTISRPMPAGVRSAISRPSARSASIPARATMGAGMRWPCWTTCCANTASSNNDFSRWRISWRGPNRGCSRSRWRICLSGGPAQHSRHHR